MAKKTSTIAHPSPESNRALRRVIRKLFGTQCIAAVYLGIHQSMLSRIINNLQVPTDLHIQKLTAFGIDLDNLE